jgi:glycosyltransferase involved in cell wall biosynthesis
MARILLSAYACEPGKGSEPAVGWMWATELAALQHEVWVITRTTNRSAIEGDTRSWRPTLHFVYCDLPPRARGWKKLRGATYFYYFIWQWLAFGVARRLNRKQGFDCVHHVTFVSLRAPSFMGFLGIPFYFGPVSGGERVPSQLRAAMSFRGRSLEWLRDLSNLLVRVDPLMRMAFSRAERIYPTSWDCLALIPSRYHSKCDIQLAIGMTREQLAVAGRNTTRSHATLRCLYVGRLLEWKGIEIALLAMDRLKQQGVAAHLTLIGSGPARRILQNRARQLGVANDLTWLPWQPHAEVQRLYSEHDLLVFPSLRDSGGMAVLEALAHGLPVVCLDLGGPTTIVNDRCGRVVQMKNRTLPEIADALAWHLRDLASNPGLLHSLSVAAQRRAWGFEFSRLIEAVYTAEPAGTAELAEVATA